MKEEEVERIVEYFTEKLYSHQYFIGRKEARDSLGLKNVTYAEEKTAGLLTQLYEKYAEEMKTGEQWNPETELGTGMSQKEQDYTIAFIESTANPPGKGEAGGFDPPLRKRAG
jgi:hypothetical protein